MSRPELARLGTCALLLQRAGALRLVADIDEALAARHAREEASDGDVYTSVDLPPRTSRRSFRERCATIASARKDGQIWIVSRADWFAATRVPNRDRASQNVTPPPAANDVAPESERAAADRMLADAGMRPTKLHARGRG